MYLSIAASKTSMNFMPKGKSNNAESKAAVVDEERLNMYINPHLVRTTEARAPHPSATVRLINTLSNGLFLLSDFSRIKTAK